MYNRDRRRSYIMSKLDVKQQKRIGDLIARMLATDSPHEATSCEKLVTRQLESVNLDVRSILFGGGSSAVSAQSEINSAYRRGYDEGYSGGVKSVKSASTRQMRQKSNFRGVEFNTKVDLYRHLYCDLRMRNIADIVNLIIGSGVFYTT